MDKSELFENQTKIVIEALMREKRMGRADAMKLWYTSKTKEIVQGSGTDLSFVSGARCYDELIMEIERYPHWMKGSFV